MDNVSEIKNPRLYPYSPGIVENVLSSVSRGIRLPYGSWSDRHETIKIFVHNFIIQRRKSLCLKLTLK